MSKSLFASLGSALAVSDEQLMWRVRTRDDQEAFARLMAKWEGPIQRLCARMLGDRFRGEDLAQETFLKLFARRKDYRPTAKFSTYLWRIALNACHDELRRMNRSNVLTVLDEKGQGRGTLENAESGEHSPDVQLGLQERAEQVRRALMRLTENYRTVLILRHYQDLKFREIAEVMSIPVGTVKSRMAEGLSQLARMLEIDATNTFKKTAEPKNQTKNSVML